MHSDLEVLADPPAVARAAAAYVADRARAAVADHGSFHFAVSGGRDPLVDLVQHDVVPGHVLGEAPADVVAMPVEDDDLDAAAATYAARLPDRLDLVHLGLGPDGHTASLVPGDPVLEVTDRLVAVTEPYQAHRRMTLTYPALAQADQLLWLVTGADKRDPLRRLLAGDPTIPAGRVAAARSLVLADAAAGETTTTDEGTSA